MLNALFLPGLGERHLALQRVILRHWRLYDIAVQIEPLAWASAETTDDKKRRVLGRIDDLAAAGGPVLLIGVSAGASTAVACLAQRPSAVLAAVSVAGKLQSPSRLPSGGENAVALSGMIADCQRSANRIGRAGRRRILCVHGLWDRVVPISDSKLEDARSLTVPCLGHRLSIGFSLTFLAPAVRGFVNSLGREA